MAKVMVLPVGAIEENAQALRTVVNKDGASYNELKDGIKSIGLLNPISVREYTKEDGSIGYRLVDGLHRLTAFQDLGLSEIPVNVVTVDDSNLLIAQFIGNNNIKTTKSQFAQGLKQLIQHKGYTVKDVARLVCRPDAWVKQQLDLLSLPESVQKLVDENKVCMANAISLTRIPKEKLEDFLQSSMTESPETFGVKVEEAVKEFKDAARQGRKPVIEFKAAPRVRKTSELKAALYEAEGTGNVADLRVTLETQGITDPFEAALATLKWVMSLDPVSVAAEKAKWDAQRAADAVKKAEKEADKQKKAASDAAQALNSEPATAA